MVLILLALSHASVRANASIPRPETVKTLPARLGLFQLRGEATEVASGKFTPSREVVLSSHLLSWTLADYESDGVVFSVAVYKWDSDAAAYADVTNWARIHHGELDALSDQIGTASVRTDRGLKFFKGSISVDVADTGQNHTDALAGFAGQLAGTFDNGEGDIPVLIKHLPDWETAQRRATYAVDAAGLVAISGDQPILQEVSFDGGTEAVAANYGQSQLLIVEFTTPQFSVENDSRIWTRIADLKGRGQPIPSAYRRVGNYSVFVFNAPDYQTANGLIDQVKYEQVVQWLGDDPHLYDKLQRYLTQTSAGVLIAVLKSSGLSLVLCLGVGGVVGALLFRHRRAQRATAFSDAGGSIRLNLDALTGPSSAPRLLSGGKRSDHDGR